MSDRLMQFSEEGNRQFSEYLALLRIDRDTPPPFHLLSDPTASQPVSFEAEIEQKPLGREFENRYEFGVYLADRLAGANRRDVSFAHLMWNWIALYYFDQLCLPNADGLRTPGEEARYVLPSQYKHDRYYRHLVRPVWLSVVSHGEKSRVLLIPTSEGGAALSTVGEIFSQIAARQGVFRSRAVVSAVYEMYFDETTGRPKKRTGGSGGGSSRRLGRLLKQFELTFDLEFEAEDLVQGILPKEFSKWKRKKVQPEAA